MCYEIIIKAFRLTDFWTKKWTEKDFLFNYYDSGK